MKRTTALKRTGFKRKSPVDRTLIQRSRISPVSKTRRSRSGKPGKLGIIRLYGNDIKDLRLKAFIRSGGYCEMQRDRVRCGWPITFENSELAHIVGRGRGGSDVIDNVLMSCKFRSDGEPGCHHLQHNPKAF